MKKRKKIKDIIFIIKTVIFTAIAMYFYTKASLESGIWTLSWSSFFEFLFVTTIAFFAVAACVSSMEYCIKN